MADGGGSLHIVVFPWLAFGHMLPFLELSKALARRGHRVSFICTPRNIQRLPKLPPEISHLIEFVPFSLPKVKGLPEAAEATTDIGPDEIPFLVKALDGLEQPFSEFINQLASPKPDWIVQDVFQPWIRAAAAVPCATFFVVSAAAMSFYGPMTSKDARATLEEMTTAPPWVPFPSKVAYRPFELRKAIVGSQAWKSSELEGVPDLRHRYKMAIQGCSVLAMRSCMELEGRYLSLLEEVFEKPVGAVGLLPPSANERSENHVTDCVAVEWLDKRSSTSVVYVALGSEAVLSTDQLRELALGLEAAKFPFIWGFRADAETLPEGFEDRTRGFGIVVKGWVPQLKILAHAAVGAFLTHCGWGSIVEGVQSGRPLVMLPICLEQGLTARSMEEKGIGFEVKRNNEDGSFTREDVVEALNLVMVMGGHGEICRKRGEEMKAALVNKQVQEKYVEDFVQYLVTHRTTTD